MLLGLSLSTVIATSALAQPQIFDLPAVQFQFTKLSVAWETKIRDFPNSDLGEGRIIRANIQFDPIVEGPAFRDDIYLRFEGAVGIAPSLILFVPGESIEILPDKSFRIFSSDPKQNGVRNVLTNSKGEIIADVTGDMTFIDMRLALINGEWRLDFEVEKRAPTFRFDWVYPGGSTGTTVVIGNSGGLATALSAETIHVMK